MILAFGAAGRHAGAQEATIEAEIRAAGAEYVAALRQGDAAAIAEFWTEDGVYVDAEGRSFRARQLVGEHFAAAGASGDERPAAAVDSTIHFAGPTFAIEQGRVGRGDGPGAQNAPPAEFIAAWVKQGDRWRLSLLRELVVAPRAASPAEPAANSIEELDWMVGRWTAVNGDAAVELTAEWAAEKKFLLHRFAARRGGETQRSGVQRIGWDAAAGRLRSWTFNADGSFAEARWRREGDVWVAESVGVLPDGRQVKSVHFWTPEGENVCWFKSLQGQLDGQPTDDLVLKFNREPAAAR
jgi:uncharacterized protein (TIGR02246 family)